MVLTNGLSRSYIYCLIDYFTNQAFDAFQLECFIIFMLQVYTGCSEVMGNLLTNNWLWVINLITGYGVKTEIWLRYKTEYTPV